MSHMHLRRISQTELGVLKCDTNTHSFNEKFTCGAIEEFISLNYDAPWIKPGSTVAFSVLPENSSVTTTVEIDTQELAPTVYSMRIAHPREVGGETYANLGVWSVGEGRRSIRAVLWVYIAGLIDPRDISTDDKIYTRCPNPAHGLLQQFELDKKCVPNSTYKMICLFNIVFEKMCTECLAKLDKDLDGLGSVDLNA